MQNQLGLILNWPSKVYPCTPESFPFPSLMVPLLPHTSFPAGSMNTNTANKLPNQLNAALPAVLMLQLPKYRLHLWSSRRAVSPMQEEAYFIRKTIRKGHTLRPKMGFIQ